MNSLPLQEIAVSDFRRLDGHRVLPLDAPVVLLHGPNGTGKTSVLSAVEFALTGAIRSMQRQDDRYTAHLPSHGQSFATVRARVSESLTRGEQQTIMTVGGARIDGQPALSPEAAQFYAERCYLDQVSLGRLLELYQYRAGKEESALAQFVNELFGLDQLDALRSGLADSTDIRKVRKLSRGLSEAELRLEQIGADLLRQTSALEAAKKALAKGHESLIEKLSSLGANASDLDLGSCLVSADKLVVDAKKGEVLGSLKQLARETSAVGGRIAGFSAKASTQRVEELRATAASAAASLLQWRNASSQQIDAFHADFAQLVPKGAVDPRSDLETEATSIDSRLTEQAALLTESQEVAELVASLELALATTEASIATTQVQAGSLATTFAAMREHIVDEVCPICERDFTEVSSQHLAQHLDRKISELTNLGRRLEALKRERDASSKELDTYMRRLSTLNSKLLSAEQLDTLSRRRVEFQELLYRFERLEPLIIEGAHLETNARRAAEAVADAEAASTEESMVRVELGRLSSALGVSVAEPTEPFDDVLARLSQISAEKIEAAERQSGAVAEVSELVPSLRGRLSDVKAIEDERAKSASEKFAWEERVKDAKRRQTVGKEVQSAASTARAAIVQRVFTESLNSVWRSVFTRLAPQEPYVPAFGIPTATRSALELKLETIHSSGSPGGPPQLMLSAGNLNTAALSLFIALHLAVDPIVPCLVFDDPVQSMDEVHVAQFAGLIRVLSKNHGRQVVIAVHERELFEYLALELSPSHDGDELITIELGERSRDADGGVTRLPWTPDHSIAV